MGEYTAAAVLSFAFQQSALTLDANLKRVFQRLDAAPEWTPAVETRWRNLWSSLVDGPSSRESNQSIMQLGQRICRAKAPLCGGCPLADGCRARIENNTDRIPVPKERQIIEKSTITVFWHRVDRSEWWLARPEKGRFSTLWMGPPAEVPDGARALSGRVHTYTKYRDRVTPFAAAWAGEDDPPLPLGWVGRWATATEARELGMVSTYRKILDEAFDTSALF